MGVAKPSQHCCDYTQGGSSKTAPPRSRKRKADNTNDASFGGKVVIDLTADSPPRKRKRAQPAEEKRLKRWRAHAPSTYQQIRDRALSQRMFVLERQRDTSDKDSPTEVVTLAGTTGNVYTITIDRLPSCNCPHARKGNQCKHMVYVLARVLRAPHHLEYQLALLRSELREIFAQAPPLPSAQAQESKKDGNRKPIEGECPICSEDFEPDNAEEEVVYCEASCGNNIHQACFKQWEATKRGGAVTCPFCRTPWQGGGHQTLHKAVQAGQVNEEGYVNVASRFGLSGQRDYSTYNPYWVRRQMGSEWY